jgi:hypothetical protein
MRAPQRGECTQNSRFLAFERARRDEDRPMWRQPEETDDAPGAPAGHGGGRFQRFELETTGDDDRAGSRTMSIILRADSSLCMQNRSTSSSTVETVREPGGTRG